ncbi:MAG: carboxypeptidase regulatory-like domain-containing protein, partial [Methanothrix sp.]|nr:carboxypeptidase regulatory-like domain-containing protein [Methanothrix sp.]
MKNKHYLAILLSLIMGGTALTAFAQDDGAKIPSFGSAMGQQANQLVPSQDQVTLKLYVLDGRSNNGQLISGVTVAIMDAAGNIFEGTTDSNGAVVFKGQPGTWQFVLSKEGYKTAKMAYNVTKSQTAAAYLQEADWAQMKS